MNPKLFFVVLVQLSFLWILWRCLPWDVRYEVRYHLRRHWWVPIFVGVALAALVVLNSLVSVKLF